MKKHVTGLTFLRPLLAARSLLRRTKKRISTTDENRRPRIENLSHSSSENNVACRNVALTLGRSNLSEFLCDSSSESNVCAGAFRGCFTVKYDRSVAFPMVRVTFRLSEATGTSVA